MSEMKDSGVEWIGEIPIDWEIVQVKYLFKIGRGRVIAQTELDDNGIYPVFSSQTKNEGCLGYINTYDFDISQLTWTTDGANAGTVFLRHGKHNCTNVCGTLQPINHDVNLRYQKYALEYIAFYHKRADTNGYKIMNNEMATIHSIFPPFDEQCRIANYLDKKCTKIDTIIATLQEIIEKLKSYKQSVITETVIRGLNPDAEMKDSGIEFIGNFPSHWKIVRLKFLLTHLIDCPHETPKYDADGKYLVIRTADQDLAVLRKDEDMFRLSESEYENRIRRMSLDKDDIVYGREGGRWGLACLVPESNKYCLGQRMLQFRCDRELFNPQFAVYALSSSTVYLQGSFDTMGSASPHVNISTVQNYAIAVPPAQEQECIAKELQKKCKNIDFEIKRRQRFIDKIIEYKKALIYEVVTGKKNI